MNLWTSVAAAAALALAAAGDPAPARACACQSNFVTVQPGPSVDAPTNTHVRVTFRVKEWEQAIGKASDVTFVIRVAGKGAKAAKPAKGKKAAAAAPALQWDRTDLESAEEHIVELAPQGELAAKTRYEVVVPRSDGKEEVIGEFKTGDGPDTAAPTFDGIKKASYVKSKDRTGTKCGSGDAYALLQLGKVDDTGTAADALVYGVWIGEGGKVAYDKPPIVYVSAVAGALQLGNPSVCGVPNFTFPAGAKQVLLGFRAIDLAGNKAETAGEVVLDLTAKKP